MHLYADPTTLAALNRPDTRRVLLHGGYGGYGNFGDILQLKGAIRFHQAHTGRMPVVVCHLAAVTGADFSAQVRRWFGVEAVIFLADARHDLTAMGLGPVREARAIDMLHMFGGGFLNGTWGALTLRQAESLMRQFRTTRYVVTGQQLDPAFMPTLARHFQQFPPLTVGGRDDASVGLIRAYGLPGGFSFDDASEILVDWAKRRPAAPTPTGRLVLHLNTSHYTDNTEPMVARLRTLLASYPAHHAPLLLQSFDDARPSVQDTLQSVIGLEEAFPVLHYEVLNLARMALRLDPADTAPDPLLGCLRGDRAMSASYHTAFFLNLLGIPCHLHASNAYYRQKTEGLGNRPSFDELLADPRPADYTERLAARGAWLSELTALLAEIPGGPGEPVTLTPPSGRLVRFWPKGRRPAWRQRLLGALNGCVAVLKPRPPRGGGEP